MKPSLFFLVPSLLFLIICTAGAAIGIICESNLRQTVLAKKLLPFYKRLKTLKQPKPMAVIIIIALVLGLAVRLDGKRERPYFVDLYADAYAARVILNDPMDMYTRNLPITWAESTCDGEQNYNPQPPWSNYDCAPYPPVALIPTAFAFWLGEETFDGFYNISVLLELIIAGMVIIYSLLTRRPFLFPLYFLSTFTYAFFWKQTHFSFTLTTAFIVLALILFELKKEGSALFFLGLASAAKIFTLPVLAMTSRFGSRKRWIWFFFVVTVFVGLVVPFFIFDNYSYIFRRENHRPVMSYLVGGIIGIEFLFLEFFTRGKDREVAMLSMVPMASYITLTGILIVPPYFQLALLIPDRTYFRNVLGILLTAIFVFEDDITGTLFTMLVIPLFLLLYFRRSEISFQGTGIALLDRLPSLKRIIGRPIFSVK
ncbi:MAG: hypothetical protein QW728_04730 [Thermoplasmata archaeon]